MNTIINTRKGKIEGLRSQDGRTVIFRGVPYAAAPVGELRFRRPQEHEPWEGVLNCTEFGPRCWQADLSGPDFYGKEFYDEMPGKCGQCSEDCLLLNIWTPAAAQYDSRLPVLFWIHGGAFLHGCGSEKEFDGEGFAKKGVILVTINYRVNAFGFFAHPDLEEENSEHVSGNYGILDQIFALKWVRENISFFGGDPEKITIFGQSAGCMSVQTIVSSPLSEGMMRGAILQSGGGIGGFGGNTPGKEQMQEVSQKLMDHLNVKTIAQLRQVPAEQLRDAAYAVGGPGMAWSPHVDGWLLPDTVDELALSGRIHDINYMIGSCGDDMGGMDLLPPAAARWCENQLKLGRRPAYQYLFDRKLPGDDAGAFHSSELWFIFETLDRAWRPWEEHDYELSRIMAAYWANFAKTGDPNRDGTGEPALLPAWEPCTEGDIAPAMLV